MTRVASGTRTCTRWTKTIPTLSAVAMALVVAAATAPAATAENDPGVHVKRVQAPDFAVQPDRVNVAFKLDATGRLATRNARATITLTKVGGRRPSYSRDLRLRNLPPQFEEAHEEVAFDGVGIGRYEARVCVRAKYGKRRVIDCKSGKDFSVIPFAWQGTSTWTANFGNLNNEGYRETADSAEGGDPLFTFARFDGRLFVYTGTGRITYEVSGTDLAGCTHNGSGTHPVETSDLTVAESLKTYSIRGERPATQTFQATQTCPLGGTFPYTAPLFSPFWLLTGTQTKAADATTLIGTHPETTFGGLWTWRFTAQ